jgi:hypothetical protein
MTRVSWLDVPEGATIRGGDGYEWQVTAISPDGAVTIEREGREPVTRKPPQGAAVELIRSAPPGAIAAAVRTIRSVFDVEVINCPYCKGETGEDCICDEGHCGAPGCINFPRKAE